MRRIILLLLLPFLFTVLIIPLLLILSLCIPSTSEAETVDTCEDIGLYAFHIANCPQYALHVDTATPLCEQEQWQHLAWMDHRCYREQAFDWKRSCNNWDCPVPYEHILIEPISGKTKVLPLNAVEIDQHYRSIRSVFGNLIPKRKAKNNTHTRRR